MRAGPSVEAVAARGRGGQLDPGDYEANYLAQAHWQGFRYYIGKMTGLDRSAKEV
jgi:NADH dehydrogenase